jgi:minor extracellular serine protease Vpr
VGLAAPGIFSLGAPEGGQGAITNSAGAVVNANSPAHAGDYLEIYCNGLGAVSNTPRTGTESAASPLSSLIGKAAVTIGGVAAPVSFAGLAPGFIGLYQVNVQVPQGTATGNSIPVILSIGAMASNTVTISVR